MYGFDTKIDKITKFFKSNNYIISFFIILIWLIFGHIFANNSNFVNNSDGLIDNYRFFDNLNVYRYEYYDIWSWWQLYSFVDNKFEYDQYSGFIIFSWKDLKNNLLPWEIVYFFKDDNRDIVSFVIQDKWKYRFFLSLYDSWNENKKELYDFFNKWLNNYELYISEEELNSIYENINTWNEFWNMIRVKYIDFLIKKWFTWFVKKPYDGVSFDITRSWYEYKINSISEKDMVDEIIEDQIKDFFIWDKFYINKWILISSKSSLSWIYLFKTKEDLINLWYEIISFRSRQNNDLEYRRHNIYTAFKNIWNILVINPSEITSFMKNIDFDMKERKNYKYWTSMGTAYWGWVCGASTAIYQGIFTNKALKIINRIPHSKWLDKFYVANINGRIVDIPWVDSTVYYKWADFVFKNVSDHPVILFMLYSWKEWDFEDVFTLWKKDDKWSLIYKKSFLRWSYSCYLRSINWNDVSSCYKSVQ